VAKSSARRRGRARRLRQRRGSTGFRRSLLVGSLLVLCTGLLAWYFRDALDATLNTSLSRTPDEAKPLASTKSERTAKGPTRQPPATEATNRFEFYEMLPDAEVEVAEQANPARPAAPPPVSRPGTYVIQAGAFPNFADADKVKARLALLGVESLIQTAQANGSVFHRVRIGPIEDLKAINRLRAQLVQNGIEYQVIPVGE
jgi:cell division protein FtsN